MIRGTTRLIAHLGYPTESFKAPMIYNPYFEKHGIDAVVVPMGCKTDTYPDFLRLVFKLSNIHGALVTMPHKVTTVGLLDDASTIAKVAGSCNAVRLGPGGALIGDMFDGEGFVRGVTRKGRKLRGARALVVGSGAGRRSQRLWRMRNWGVDDTPTMNARRSSAQILPGVSRRWLERSGWLGCRSQCDPARHEGRRSAADGCRAYCAVDFCWRGGDEERAHAFPRSCPSAWL